MTVENDFRPEGKPDAALKYRRLTSDDEIIEGLPIDCAGMTPTLLRDEFGTVWPGFILRLADGSTKAVTQDSFIDACASANWTLRVGLLLAELSDKGGDDVDAILRDLRKTLDDHEARRAELRASMRVPC